ncbi:MAG: hypothetical protein K2H03_10075, partial [Muribaculaceae bacterium]|nr:hypothetical protein [Muribaculaceae bacterium]
MEKERTSVVFYLSWWKLAKELDESKRMQLIDAILDYAFFGIEPEDDFIKMGTYQMRDQLDRDREKYERICERRREYSRLGVMARKAKAAKLENQEQEDGSDDNHEQPKGNLKVTLSNHK